MQNRVLVWLGPASVILPRNFWLAVHCYYPLMAIDSFESARLTARRPSEGDFSTFRRIHTDKGTMKALSVDGSILTERQSREVLDRHLKHWESSGFGIWLFSTKSNGASIGYCGLRRYELHGREEIELFYGVRSRHFRRGFGFEMASTVVGQGFKELGLPSIIAFTLEENAASRGLMVKLGMKYEGVIEHAGLPHVLYRLTNPHGWL